ncbi:hypothetical protein DOZ80_25830 [Pseudomonas fluorescens]|uniref:Uncharacterized protein n=1 Tax=Pseudomonas fluorescens TaxID=294 RepID=A0A327MNX0_PSEFL|nr:hypothetical protein [Pseudomonas fluorescens]RAI64547.1 hypothetical protein DOZ80_25830 [Pseudomonas fluorescens]
MDCGLGRLALGECALSEIQRFVAETRELMAEQSRLKQETFWYPFAVGAGRVTAIVAAFGAICSYSAA